MAQRLSEAVANSDEAKEVCGAIPHPMLVYNLRPSVNWDTDGMTNPQMDPFMTDGMTDDKTDDLIFGMTDARMV